MTAPLAPLVQRAAFGAHAGNEPYDAGSSGLAGHLDLEARIGGPLRRMVWFANMDVGFPTAAAAEAARTGHTPVISWDTGAHVDFADLLAGRWDAQLDAFFAAVAAYPGEVVLRPWWEMNANAGRYAMAYPGADRAVSSVAQWIEAWGYLWHRAKDVGGAANATFFFCGNGSDVGGYPLEDYFPGTSYVDQIGFDTYNETHYATWTSFDDKVAPMYARCAALHPTAPIALGELGTVDAGGPPGQDKATWLQGMFTSTAYPRLRFVDLFSVVSTQDWRIDQTAASLAVSRQYLGTPVARIPDPVRLTHREPTDDVNTLAAHVNAASTALGHPTVDVPVRTAGQGSRDDFRDDVNALRAHVDALAARHGVAPTAFPHRRRGDVASWAADLDELLAAIERVLARVRR